MSTSVVLQQVEKRYGDVEVIHGIDLNIDPGEFTVFVGPSGCGKSTLLRMIAGLEPISGGSLLIDGERMNEVPAAKRGIAMVFQSYALYPHMNVYQNLAFGLETARVPKPEIQQRVQKAADILRIEPLLKRKPKQLSGGQRQRVAIGRAIVREPRIFLFDEPLSNLDAELRVQMRVEIAKLHNDLGNTMIYVTHDQVEAMTMADKIVVLRAGRVEQVGTPLELFDFPANLFVAGFLGSPRMNILKGRIVIGDDRRVLVDVGQPALLESDVDPASVSAGQEVLAGIRPAHFVVSDEGLPFEVQYHESLGTETYVYGTLQGQAEQVIVHQPGHFAPAAGAVLKVMPQEGRLHVFDPASELALARRHGGH